MKIVLTGSLGHIGSPLTKELLEQGHLVTVISSNSGRVKEIEALGARAAIGTVRDINFLQETFAGADALYCMTPPNFSVPDQIEYYLHTAECYAQAIRQSGVKRVLYLSSYGAHLPSGTGFITGSYQAEQVFNQIHGISLTHIRPAFFYDNLFQFIPTIKSAGFIAAVYGAEDLLTMVSPKDIASVIAEEITQLSHTKIVRYVYSDEKTCNEIARILGQAIDIPNLEWRILQEDQFMQALIANGMSTNAAENLTELGKATHSGILREDFDQHKPKAGKIKLEEFATAFATVYNHN